MEKSEIGVLAKEIEVLYREHRFTKFPYRDCRKLQKVMPWWMRRDAMLPFEFGV